MVAFQFQNIEKEGRRRKGFNQIFREKFGSIFKILQTAVNTLKNL